MMQKLKSSEQKLLMQNSQINLYKNMKCFQLNYFVLLHVTIMM